MGGRQVKMQEFLTDSQVEANASTKDVSSKLEKAGASKLTAVIVELETAIYERWPMPPQAHAAFLPRILGQSRQRSRMGRRMRRM